MPVPTDDYIAGMRRLAAGVTIVTTCRDDKRAGLTATSVCSLTAEPPRLLACINRDIDAHTLILESGVFVVNVLTAAHRELAECFGGRDDCQGEDRFALGRWRKGLGGAPVLVGAAACFECRLVHATPVGTHTIFVGEIEALTQDDDSSALVYHDRAYHRLIGWDAWDG